MSNAGPFAAAAAIVLALPVIVVVVLGSGTGSTPAAAAGLKAGTVPTQYPALVEQAGMVCAAAPASLIAGQLQQESGWNPNAVSSAGAEGIGQFLPTTWPSWSAPGTSPFDPVAAISAQAKYDCAIA